MHFLKSNAQAKAQQPMGMDFLKAQLDSFVLLHQCFYASGWRRSFVWLAVFWPCALHKGWVASTKIAPSIGLFACVCVCVRVQAQ